jgi:hypothetical protein
VGRLRRILFELAVDAVPRALIATVRPHRRYRAAWRIAAATRLLTWRRGTRFSAAVVGIVFLELLRRLTIRGARFAVPCALPPWLLALWERRGAMVLIGPHTPLLAVPLARAITDAGRDCVGIYGSGDAVRNVIGTDRMRRHIEQGPQSLLAARRALMQGKALIAVIDNPSPRPALNKDRVISIGGREVFIYANTFRLAMLVGVPVVFHCASLQKDGVVAFAFETARCEVPRSEDDVQSCLDDYVCFLEDRAAAGWL